MGHVVLVPFGRTSETGYVVGLADTSDVSPDKMKPITRLVDRVRAFDAKQLEFFRWIADYYLSPLGMVIHTALPSEISARVVNVLNPTDAGIDALTAREVEADAGIVLRELISRPGLTRRGMKRRLDAEVDAKAVDTAIDLVVKHEWAMWDEREINELKGTIATVSLVGTADAALATVPRAGKRMRSVIDSLHRNGQMDVAELVAEQGATARDALKRLKSAGVVRLQDRERRDPLADGDLPGDRRPPMLNDDQLAAMDGICSDPRTHLLFGVTGSGKTEVFLGAARRTLDQQRQVLVLVPEIGLTPQLVGRFRARFGDAVAVLHSGLTGSERISQWRRIRAGEASVAVGARSALFAPFSDLGLIVVDEEHDDSYKQDDGVRYNARDLAVVLGRRRNCPVVLASATPSLESWFNASRDRYGLQRLPKRATARPVPEIQVVDLCEVQTPQGKPRPVLAPVVQRALAATFAAGGKAIVLYNRRGYATMVQCTGCGGSFECPNCGITLTLHRSAGILACHYCGLKVPKQTECPACNKPQLEELGKGTERVEEALAELFPDVPLMRMDADTTAGRGAHHRILEAFREARPAMLVGTQIVAKGHDFPDVHVAVVISADQGFRMPDFRAAERTHALLVQVAGRAGRGDTPGQVFVQTWKPEHYAVQALDNVEGFFSTELRIRNTMRYPPFSRLCLVRLDGVDRNKVRSAADRMSGWLRKRSVRFPGVAILGPAPAAMPRLVGRWRFQIIVRGMDVRSLRAYLSAHLKSLQSATRKGVRVTIDVDPRHLM